MDRTLFLTKLQEALGQISAPRLFQNEQGFQGALLAELIAMRHELGIAEDGLLIEQEHQKRASIHALRIRPDVIVHVPFDAKRHGNRREDNFVVLELKVRATKKRAAQDIAKLCQMLDVLHYGLGVFINVDSGKTYFDLAPEAYRDRLAAFAVRLDGKTVVVSAAGTW